MAIDSLAGAELPIPRPALARRSLNNDIVVPMLPRSIPRPAGRAAQKARFGGELFPNVIEAESGLTFSEFFQNERDTGRKGIIVIQIGGQ